MKSNINDLKNRINSIKETAQITKAMQLISAAKLNKINEKYHKNVTYLKKVSGTIGTILEGAGDITHRYLLKRKIRHRTYLVIAGDTGLAGDYNNRVLKYALKEVNAAENKKVYTIGHIANEFFVNHGITPDVKFLYCAQDPILDDAIRISKSLIGIFDREETDEVILIYTESEKFSYNAVRHRLLPLSRSMFTSDKEERWGTATTFEPSKKEVFDLLVPQYVIGVVYTALIHAVRCEQTERMVTMNSATKNAKEMIEKLQLEFNGLRQSLITTEITEISRTVLRKE